MVSIKFERDVQRNLPTKALMKVVRSALLSSLIFNFCVDVEASTPRPNQAPLNISQVCKQWRTVSHENPRLWTQLSLSCVDLNSHTKEQHIALAKLWFKLSGDLSITLSLRYPTSSPKLPGYEMQPMYHQVLDMFTFLGQHPRKLNELSVATMRGLFFPLIYMLESGLPNLRKCHLIPTEGITNVFDEEYPPFSWPVNLTGCITLRELTFPCEYAVMWTTVYIPASLVSFEAYGFNVHVEPASQLGNSVKKLVFRQLPGEDIGAVLPCAKGTMYNFAQDLVDLEITLQDCRDPFDFPTEIKLPKLRSLCIKFEVTPTCSDDDEEMADVVEVFLFKLNAPAMKSLEVDWRAPLESQMTSWPPLSCFYALPAPGLESLSLHSVAADDSDDLLDFLPRFPNLRYLHLSGRHITEHFVTSFILKWSEEQASGNGTNILGGLCPRLRELSLRVRKPVSDNLLVKLWAPRKPAYRVSEATAAVMATIAKPVTEVDQDGCVLMKIAFDSSQHPA